MRPISSKNFGKDKLKATEQLAFLDYLSQSLNNGFSLSSSLALLPALWPQKASQMQALNLRMKKGSSLQEELLRLGFPQTTVTQINLAMKEGNLVLCLTQLAILARIKNEQIKKLRTELSYPFILALMMIALLLFMQTFVLNQLSNQNEHTGDLFLVALIALVLLTIFWIGQIMRLLAQQDYFSLKKLSHYPFLGKTVEKYVQYLVVYDIGLLLTGGFSLQKMCAYASEQAPGSVQQYLGQAVRAQLLAGKSIKSIIQQESFLPDSLLALLQTGADRHSLGQRSLLLGQSLFKELSSQIEQLVINVQPLCFVLIGLAIIGLYLKLLLPMYAMMQSI